MRNPLPVREIREILGDQGFLRLYGQDQFLYISDAPRMVSGDTLTRMQNTMRERGFIVQTDPSDLLLIDLRPERWEALLNTFQSAAAAAFPQDERLIGVYALARLVSRHPSDFARQPMDMIRSVLKQYGIKDGLPTLAPKLYTRCAEKLRRGEPLPSALANALSTWLYEQS